MHHASPLLAGSHGFKAQNLEPDLISERLPELWYGTRRIPSVLRVANPETVQFLGKLNESTAYAAVRYWIEPSRISKIHQKPPDGAPEHAVLLQSWAVYPGNGAILAWWRGKRDTGHGRTAWRSPREFVGYGSRMKEMRLPKVEPFEVANFRLPDDISCDADVVLFQAWCQGFQHHHFAKDNPLKERYATAIRSGLEKFCRSPWVRFAIAAPFMEAVGVMFPGHSYFDTSMRMEYLLQNPFHATDEELKHIMMSSTFTNGFNQARAARRGGRYLSPSGGWYAGGSLRQALGTDFKRGGTQPSGRLLT